MNSCWNIFHTIGALSLIGSSSSIHQPMSRFHPETSGPLMSVRVRATLLMGELNPATSWFRRRYPLTSSMNSSAVVLSPVNTWGSVPITDALLIGVGGGYLLCSSVGGSSSGGFPLAVVGYKGIFLPTGVVGVDEVLSVKGIGVIRIC